MIPSVSFCFTIFVIQGLFGFKKCTQKLGRTEQSMFMISTKNDEWFWLRNIQVEESES